MAEITINGVKYTNVPNKKAGTKFAASLTQSNIGASQAVQDYVNSAYFYPLVNAIDINWNGVEVDENSYINTTSDLISYIASKESNIDLSSYATMTYVDQKITDLIGGAPETLDTLKELADALADDASLAYVTQALDGKADKSSLTNYATNSYVTTELDKKADKSDIPAAPDLTPYVTYTQANSYYSPKYDHIFHRFNDSTKGVDIAYLVRPGSSSNLSDIINRVYNVEGFSTLDNSSELIILSTLKSTSSKKISIGGGNSIIGGGLMNRNGSSYTYLSNGIFIGRESKIGQKFNNNQYVVDSGLFIGDHIVSNSNNQYILGNYNALTNNAGSTIGFNVDTTMFAIGNGSSDNARHNAFEVRKNGKIYIADTFNGTPYVLQTKLNSKADLSYVTSELANKANLSDIPVAPDLTPYVSYEQANSYYAYKSDIPDMSNYVSVSSYNALVARVEELAGWIVSYHIPTPTGEFAFEWGDMNMNIGDVLTPPITNTYEYSNITYLSSDNGIFTVDGNGECTAVGSGNASLTASLLDNSNNVVTTASLAVIVAGSPGPGPEFHYDNEYIDMNIGDTITPSITNTYPDYNIISYTSSDSSVVSVDSNGTCTALTLGQATISATLYDNNNNEQAFSSVQLNVNKFVPVAYWSFNGTALPDNEIVVLPYDTLTQSTYTFYSDPATGWGVGDTLYETPGITIDSSTHNITVDPTSFEHAGKGRAQVDYNEDATYQQKSYSIEFKILAQGADPEFFFASDDVNMSQNYTQTEVQLYDLTGLTEQGYTPTLTVSNPSYVSAAPRQDAPNIIQFTWLAEGETTVTATITDGNNTHSTTINVHCKWDRDWTDGHVYTSQNNEVNDYYGIVQSGSNPSLTFTASNGNTQDPMNGDLFEVSIPNDTYNIVSYTSTSSGLTISFDTSAAANASVGDEINMTIIKQQDTTYGYYTKDLRFKVVPNGNDPMLWWNGDTFTVTENDVYSQDPITNWLSNQIIDFSTWQPLTPTLSISPSGVAHLDQDNVLHGDSAGYCNLVATVTDLNNNTHTATATVHVEAAVYSNTSVYYNNDPNQGQGFLDTNPYTIGLSNAGMQVNMSFEGPEYNTNNASNDFSIVYDTNFSTPKAMDASVSSFYNTYSSGVNHIVFSIDMDNVAMSTAGEQNRFILTFDHSGTNYLTDYIKFEFTGADS